MNRKASLNLSIQAIVIIVLAMTILGLGLGFVRGLFDNIVGISESTFQKITEQLSTDLATSSAPLLFSQTKLNMERGKSDLQGLVSETMETLRLSMVLTLKQTPVLKRKMMEAVSMLMSGLHTLKVLNSTH